MLRAFLVTFQENILDLIPETPLIRRLEHKHKKLPSKASATTITKQKTLYQAHRLSPSACKYPFHKERIVSSVILEKSFNSTLRAWNKPQVSVYAEELMHLSDQVPGATYIQV